MTHFDRRRFMSICSFSAVAGAAGFGLAKEQKITTKTYTYKKVGNLEIKADVIRADDNVRRPVVVSIHGGALIMGHRAGVSGRMKKMLLDAGYAIVSIDYRLAPETQLPAIIEDVEDAFTWIDEQGPKLFNIDPNRVAVMGGSAGGYLTLLSGHRAKPRPRVLISFWGYGDLVGDFYTLPSKHARHHRSKMNKEEAFSQVAGPPISDSRNRKGDGGAFYQYCRRTGIWPKEVAGWDPRKEPEKFFPYMPVKNIDSDYPPTLMIHGTKDTDVPYELSAMMAKEFKKKQVEHRLITIEGGEHGLGGGDPKKIDAAYQSAFDFLHKHMGR